MCSLSNAFEEADGQPLLVYFTIGAASVTCTRLLMRLHAESTSEFAAQSFTSGEIVLPRGCTLG
jgi:hypothetical protein